MIGQLPRVARSERVCERGIALVPGRCAAVARRTARDPTADGVADVPAEGPRQRRHADVSYQRCAGRRERHQNRHTLMARIACRSAAPAARLAIGSQSARPVDASACGTTSCSICMGSATASPMGSGGLVRRRVALRREVGAAVGQVWRALSEVAAYEHCSVADSFGTLTSAGFERCSRRVGCSGSRCSDCLAHPRPGGPVRSDAVVEWTHTRHDRRPLAGLLDGRLHRLALRRMSAWWRWLSCRCAGWCRCRKCGRPGSASGLVRLVQVVNASNPGSRRRLRAR